MNKIVLIAIIIVVVAILISAYFIGKSSENNVVEENKSNFAIRWNDFDISPTDPAWINPNTKPGQI